MIFVDADADASDWIFDISHTLDTNSHYLPTTKRPQDSLAATYDISHQFLFFSEVDHIHNINTQSVIGRRFDFQITSRL